MCRLSARSRVEPIEGKTKPDPEQNKTNKIKQTKSNKRKRKRKRKRKEKKKKRNGRTHILHPKSNKSKQYITNKISNKVV